MDEIEVREQYLLKIWEYIEYWNNQPCDREKALQGLAFSMLVILDGCATGVPGFTVSPVNCPGIDIAGGLHEVYYGYRP